jgi:hypothetical protein
MLYPELAWSLSCSTPPSLSLMPLLNFQTSSSRRSISVSGASSVWETLTAVVNESGGQGAAALLVMLAFMIFSVILLIYYVSRLVVLFLGAVLSPLVIVLYLAT